MRYNNIPNLRRTSNEKKVFLLILCLSVTPIVCSQSTDYKSLTYDEIDSINKFKDPYDPSNRGVPLKFYRDILNISKKKGYQRGEITSLYNLGTYHYVISNNVDSMVHYYNRSILKINESQELLDLRGEILANKAVSLVESGKPLHALSAFKESYRYTLKTGDKELIRHSMVNLAEYHRQLGNYHEAISYSKELINDSSELSIHLKVLSNGIIGSSKSAIGKAREGLVHLEIASKLAKKEGWKTLEGDLLLDKAQAYFNMKQYMQAIELIDQFELNFSTISGGEYRASNLLGNCQMAIGKNRLALNTLVQGLKENGSTKDKVSLLEALVFCHLELGNTTKAKELFNTSKKIKDSLINARKQQYAEYLSTDYNLIKAQYDYELLKNQNTKLEAKSAKERYLIYILLASFLILSFMILGVVLFKRLNKNKRIITRLRIREKTILQDQIKIRENELKATNIYLSKHNTIVNEIKQSISQINAKQKLPEFAKILETINGLENSMVGFNLLSNRIESEHMDISSVLSRIYPKLTRNDINHCILIKLGMSLKESARLMNISVSAVKSVRRRMKKKMKLDVDTSLKRHIESLTS